MKRYWMGLDIGGTKCAVLLATVDGGIHLDNVALALDAGANVIVAGSAVFKDDIAANAKAFLAKMQ